MTFDRILVPLDGSHLAEASLPAAEALGKHLGSVLVLVHALEQDPPHEVHGEPHLDAPARARAYLERRRDRLRAKGLQAEVHLAELHDSDVALAIDRLADELDTGLILMCAHGRNSLRDRLLGPIAQRALRGGGETVMLRTAGASVDGPFEIRHILFPIDFRHELDTAMDDILALASGFGASVTLFHAASAHVSGIPARMLPTASSVLSDTDLKAARDRLSELATRLRAADIPTEVAVSEEDPEEGIIEHATERATDLVVLVTHGRSGVAAWYERSVGRRVIEEPGLTLLLLRGASSDRNERG